MEFAQIATYLGVIMKANNSLRRVAALAFAVFLAACASSSLVFQKDGLALRGYNPVAYFTQGQPVKGLPQFQAQHQGAVFHFASAAHRDSFVAAPEQYAPQYGGCCAFGMSNGYKAATDPASFTLRQGKLYLNYNSEVQKMWTANMPALISKADQLWPAASTQTKVHE
jgi:YHS domain-containing protein